MTHETISRRAIMVGATALVATSPLRTLAQGVGPSIHVMKDPNCGCCSAWIDILANDGFAVTTEASAGTLLMRYKLDGAVRRNAHVYVWLGSARFQAAPRRRHSASAAARLSLKSSRR